MLHGGRQRGQGRDGSEGQGTAEAPEEQKAEQVGREDEILGVWDGGEDPAGVWARLGCKHGYPVCI